MLNGFDVGEMFNTPKEAVLVKHMKQEQELDYLKNMLTFKSATLDKSSQEEIDAYNKLLNSYFDLYNNVSKESQEKKKKQVLEDVKRLNNMDMSKIKVTNKQSGKLKII